MAYLIKFKQTNNAKLNDTQSRLAKCKDLSAKTIASAPATIYEV